MPDGVADRALGFGLMHPRSRYGGISRGEVLSPHRGQAADYHSQWRVLTVVYMYSHCYRATAVYQLSSINKYFNRLLYLAPRSRLAEREAVA